MNNSGKGWTLLRSSLAPTRKRLLWLAVVLAAIAGLFWILHPPPKPKRVGRHSIASGPMPVVAGTASKADVDVSLSELGTVTPLATVTVQTQINGQLVQIAFQEGQMVKKGDFMAEIDPRPYQVALQQAKAQLAHDKALLKDAQIDLKRYQTLVAQDSIAEQQRDTQEYLVKQYKGTVAVDQAQIDSAKLNLTYCHITAPVSGRVGLRQIDQGNYVTSGEPNGLFVITELQPISVVFTVPEDNVPSIMQRLQAGASLDALAFDRSASTQLAEGKLSTTDNQIDTSTGTLKLRALFDNKDLSLFPNQFVNIKLVVSTLHDATIIPSAAIERGATDLGTYVYLVNPDGKTVSVRKVTLGPVSGDNTAITQGLVPGDRIVVDGADKLRDGAEITLPQAGDSSTSATSPDSTAAAAASGSATGQDAPAAGDEHAKHKHRHKHAPADDSSQGQ